MVGPGTGLAPFRAFIKHRLLQHPERAARGPMALYFGCRHRAGKSSDYLYGAQLEAWGADGAHRCDALPATEAPLLWSGGGVPQRNPPGLSLSLVSYVLSTPGTLELHTAFSRDSTQKVYVQHRVAETAERVWALLQQGGHFYVCGDANAMAGDVDRELRKIAAARLEGGEAAADAFIKGLEAEHRYERDVWFS